MVNTKCPYCGSENILAYCPIVVSGHLNSDGKIIVNLAWAQRELSEAVARSPQDDLQGYCYDCGNYCRFSWNDGFIKGDTNDD